MKRLWYKIRLWFWFKFIATERQKLQWDMVMYGTAIQKDGKRIDPRKFKSNL